MEPGYAVRDSIQGHPARTYASPEPEEARTPPRPAPTVWRKAVVVHAGARDSYQLALGLSEAGTLESLVTDLFWPSDRRWANWIAERLPRGLRALLRQRGCPGLPFSQITLAPFAGLKSLLMERAPRLSFSLRRWATRSSDNTLGKRAGSLARRSGSGLISYSYTGFQAFQAFGRPGILFQAHPHPGTMRRILQQELALHPDCAASLEQEWELSLPEDDYARLVEEPRMASHLLAASSFTRASLVEHGIPAESISVIPYGVDLARFHPPANRRSTQDRRLQLLFVGRINQRKGIKYLLEALRLLQTDEVHLTVCGRVVDDLSLFEPFRSQVTIRPSVSGPELVAAYQAADLFVFPSVAEGFGQVLLESLSSGLPILSTTHTAAPDLITDGIEGFVVEPRRPDLLAGRIQWALEHRDALSAMRIAARARAEHFTWARFRAESAAAILRALAAEPAWHGATSD